MRINELFEVSANPAYLRAAERSRSQAQATQRTFDKSPEEKAAARRTELKRDAGIAGYTKRHRAANPDAYPTPKTQPAPQLRDPSTEYSDDYSVWAAGRRDTMEQGVAEGSDDTIYPNAEVIKSKNGRPVGEIYQDGNSWGCFHYRADRGYEFLDSREDAIEALKDLHQETGRSRPDYTIKGVAEGPMPPRPTPKWSPEQAIKRQHSRRELARAQFLKKKAEQPPTAGMSAAEKVDKGWRNPNM